MSKRFNFPHNNKLYIKKIINHIQSNELEKALELAEEAYKIEKSFDNNYLYVHILSTLNRYKEAYELAHIYEEDYLENNITTYAYILLLIKTHHFIKAEYLILQFSESSEAKNIEWDNLQNKLDNEKSKVEKKLQEKRIKIKLNLLQIAEYSEIVQHEIIREAQILKLSTLQNNAEYIFQNPNLSLQIKKSYLELLIIKRDSNKYDFEWFNKSIVICPLELKTFDATLKKLNVEQLLAIKLEKRPSLFEVIRYEIINDMLLLYPFVEETITDLEFWIDQYIKYFDSSYIAKKDNNIKAQEKENMKKWIEKMHLLSHRV